ncbi:MAG: DUF4277 domain-containing protein [Ktedonobacteraceae bacterium]
MPQEVEYQTQRLDHLGIVAGICREAGIAEWLDEHSGEQRRIVSVGTATVAMILNGPGFGNRQLYLVSQYFENKPVEHLLSIAFGLSVNLCVPACFLSPISASSKPQFS